MTDLALRIIMHDVEVLFAGERQGQPNGFVNRILVLLILIS